MIKCLECQLEFKDRFALSRHLARHKIDQETYFLKHLGTKGCCSICSNPTRFRSLWEGYTKTCGHSCGNAIVFNRLRSNPAKYQAFRNKISNVVREQWAINPNMKFGFPKANYMSKFDYDRCVLSKEGEKNLEDIFLNG